MKANMIAKRQEVVGGPANASIYWLDTPVRLLISCLVNVKSSANEETERIRCQRRYRHFPPRPTLRLVLLRLLARKAENR